LPIDIQGDSIPGNRVLTVLDPVTNPTINKLVRQHNQQNKLPKTLNTHKFTDTKNNLNLDALADILYR
jgi:hypothetical protein